MRAYLWCVVGLSGIVAPVVGLAACGSNTSSGAGVNRGDAGTGGAGGSGAGGASSCPDVDRDGETVCAGDCDDNDPSNYSRNPEACGDSADNNCDGAADETCPTGVGTYVSSTTGNDSNPGTQSSPVATIARGMANAQTIQTSRGGGPVDVFVADGQYTEKVTLVEGIGLLGGYACSAASCTWSRNAATCGTVITATDGEGMHVTDAITRATRIDGFQIMGQDGGPFSPRGRAAITITGGSPTITNNCIFAPNVSQSGFLTGRTQGILSYGTSNSSTGPFIGSNRINDDASGTMNVASSAGEPSAGITVEAVGGAGGIVAEIRDNVIRGGTGRVSRGIAAWGTGAATLIDGNDIGAGTAVEVAYGIVIGNAATINGNTINVGTTASCGSTTQWCGGIQSESSTTTITNNVVLGADADRSVGVFLGEFEVPAGAVVLNSNTIDAAGRSSGTRSAAVVVSIGPCNTCGFNGRVGKIRNNILIAGIGSTRVGLFEDAPAGKTQHPAALENNLFFASTTGSGSGALYGLFDGTTATLLTTIAQVNGLGTQITGSPIGGNLDGDPQVSASYHITSTSLAAGAAIATEAPGTDMDGDSRPQGSPDIGADEVP